MGIMHTNESDNLEGLTFEHMRLLLYSTCSFPPLSRAANRDPLDISGTLIFEKLYYKFFD